MMSKFIPDRKWLAGGIFTAVAAFLALLVNHYFGWGLGEMEIGVIALILGKGAEYWLSPSQKDILKRMNDDIVEIAASDPISAVSEDVGAMVKAKKAAEANYQAVVSERAASPSVKSIISKIRAGQA